ncbi:MULTISPECIES: hypothetical protein [Bacteroidota]|jgi:hypothetical protein|uniref:hypothetical protein n=1 Tax=Polaribacter sp. TaxID=1920175 RepID=UPI0040488BE9
MNKDQKIQLLKAFFEKSISKDDMKFLLEVGLSIPPIQWIFENEEEEQKFDRKRELVGKVLGRPLPKIILVEGE